MTTEELSGTARDVPVDPGTVAPSTIAESGNPRSAKSTVRRRWLWGGLLAAIAVSAGVRGLHEFELIPGIQPTFDTGFAQADFIPANRAFDLSKATIPQEEIRIGVPRKDAIPSLSDQTYVEAVGASFMRANDRVVGVVVEDRPRAYPLKILNFHEAVNDKIGEQAFAVTYCPLCDSAVVFDRRRAAGDLELGISGLLYNSNVLLYDRQNGAEESLWSQMMGQAVSGPLVKQSLKTLPVELTTWRDWSSRYPRTHVLSTKTGHSRRYHSSPYGKYFASPSLMFPAKPTDDRLPLKTPVLGIWSAGKTRAYPVTAFRGAKRAEQTNPMQIEQELGGHKFALAYNPDSNSLRIVSAEEGLEWMYAFWFAWYAFHPGTEVYMGR